MLWEFIGETSERMHVVHGGLYTLEITTATNGLIWAKWQARYDFIAKKYTYIECPYSNKEAFFANWRIYDGQPQNLSENEKVVKAAEIIKAYCHYISEKTSYYCDDCIFCDASYHGCPLEGFPYEYDLEHVSYKRMKDEKR